MHILVVEDSQLMNTLICSTLQDEGFETESAFDGQEALDLVAQNRPELIVMDIMMPVMDGFEATEKLKSQPETSEIPIVVLTALTKVHDVVKALGAGADAFLNKPFDGPTLVDRISNILQTREQVQSGDTAEQKAIQEVREHISVSGPKQQIFQAIFNALNQVTECTVFSVLVAREGGDTVFVVTSESPIPERVMSMFREQVFSVAERVLRHESSGSEVEAEMIYIGDAEEAPKFAPPYRSTIHVPFYVGEEANGILSIGTTGREAYDEDDFKFVFDLGAEAGPTLSKVTT